MAFEIEVMVSMVSGWCIKKVPGCLNEMTIGLGLSVYEEISGEMTLTMSPWISFKGPTEDPSIPGLRGRSAHRSFRWITRNSPVSMTFTTAVYAMSDAFNCEIMTHQA